MFILECLSPATGFEIRAIYFFSLGGGGGGGGGGVRGSLPSRLHSLTTYSPNSIGKDFQPSLHWPVICFDYKSSVAQPTETVENCGA